MMSMNEILWFQFVCPACKENALLAVDRCDVPADGKLITSTDVDCSNCCVDLHVTAEVVTARVAKITATIAHQGVVRDGG